MSPPTCKSRPGEGDSGEQHTTSSADERTTGVNKYTEARLRLAAVNRIFDSVIVGDSDITADMAIEHAVVMLDQVLVWLRAA